MALLKNCVRPAQLTRSFRHYRILPQSRESRTHAPLAPRFASSAIRLLLIVLLQVAATLLLLQEDLSLFGNRINIDRSFK